MGYSRVQIFGVVCIVAILVPCSALAQVKAGDDGSRSDSGNASYKKKTKDVIATKKKEESHFILEVLIDRVYGTVGDDSDLSIEIKNCKNEPLCFMNLRLDYRMGQTLAVEVRDSNGCYRGDLLGCPLGPSRKPLYDDDWVVVQTGEKVVSPKIPFQFGMVPNTFYSEKNPLPPGDYTLTAVAKQRILTLPPWREHDHLRTVKGLSYLQSKPILDERRKMRIDFPADSDEAIVRSKPVSITIVKKERPN